MHFRSGGVDPGRDGCRVPLPWSGSQSPFGFSPGTEVKPWLPQPTTWGDLTVDRQEDDPGSFLSLYRTVLGELVAVKGRSTTEICAGSRMRTTSLPSPGGTDSPAWSISGLSRSSCQPTPMSCLRVMRFRADCSALMTPSGYACQTTKTLRRDRWACNDTGRRRRDDEDEMEAQVGCGNSCRHAGGIARRMHWVRNDGDHCNRKRRHDGAERRQWQHDHFGCGSSEPVTLRVVSLLPGSDEAAFAAFDERVAEFEALYPHITVEAEEYRGGRQRSLLHLLAAPCRMCLRYR